MRYRPDRRERTRQRLLKEASVIIRKDGLDGLTIGSVSKRLKMTHGGFYLHFASRDDLIAQAVIGMFDNPFSALLAQTNPSDPKDTLHQLVDFYLSLEHCKRRQTGCPIPILAADHGRLPKAARERFTQAVQRFTRHVARLLDQSGVGDGEARATSAVAEMIGAVAIARVHEGDLEAEKVLRSAKQSVRAKLAIAPS